MRLAWLLLLAGCSSRPASAPATSGDAPASSREAPPMQLDAPVGEPFPSSPPCSADDECGWARCQRSSGRCAFPCAGDGECADGARCLPSPGNPDILVCAAPVEGP